MASERRWLRFSRQMAVSGRFEHNCAQTSHCCRSKTPRLFGRRTRAPSGRSPGSRSNRKWHGARRDRRASMMECHSRPGTDWPRIVRSVESCAREGKSMKWPKGFGPKRTAGSSKNRAKWLRSAIEVLQAQIIGREIVNGLNQTTATEGQWTRSSSARTASTIAASSRCACTSSSSRSPARRLRAGRRTKSRTRSGWCTSASSRRGCNKDPIFLPI